MNEVESIRLADFRQLKKEIRGSREYLIVGIDVAKERHHAFFGTATGETLLKRLIFDNSLEGFRKLLEQVRAIQVAQGLPKVVFGVEPTANYHKPLGEYLIKCGRMVVLVSGVAVKNNRKSLDGRWDKNDSKDAANVADLIFQGKCLFYEYPEVEAIVRWCLDPSRIAGFENNQFRDLVSPNRKSRALHQRLQAIQELAMDSVGCPMGEGAAFEAKVMVEGLRQIRMAIKDTDDQIQERCRQFPEYEYLLTIPGFGPDISAKVLGALGNPFRFENRKQVLKMAGLDLGAERSGKTSDTFYPVISKKGKADLRYALYQAAFIASTRNKEFKSYYAQQLAGREKEKGINTKRKVKLAAKLLVIAWTIMKKKEPFDFYYLNSL